MAKLHALLPWAAQIRRVTARGLMPDGRWTVAAGSKTYLAKVIRAALQEGEEALKHKPAQDVHAELRPFIRGALGGGIPLEIEIAGAKFCPYCTQILKAFGYELSGYRATLRP